MPQTRWTGSWVAYSTREKWLAVTLPGVYATIWRPVGWEDEIPGILDIPRTFDNDKYSESFSERPIYGSRKAPRSKRSL